MTELLQPEFLPFYGILVIVAFLYSSVGHGGGSGYLALMALFSFPTILMKPTALLLNIFVSGISFWFFRKHKHFNFKLFWPFAITSVPAAFLGGTIQIDPQLYKQTLGVFLLLAILRMLGLFGSSTTTTKRPNLPLSLLIGLAIGLFSGMIGIGGGIILSPVIILLGWGNMKQAAAVSALFIFVNSIAGFVGFSASGGQFPIQALALVPIALFGGYFGAHYGSQKLNHNQLRYILAFVLLVASIKLFLI